MNGHDDDASTLSDFLKDLDDHEGTHGIKAGGGFVQEEYDGVVDDVNTDGYAAPPRLHTPSVIPVTLSRSHHVLTPSVIPIFVTLCRGFSHLFSIADNRFYFPFHNLDRIDASKLEEWARVQNLNSLFEFSSKEGEVEGILKDIAERAGRKGEFSYSRFFAVGLFHLLELANAIEPTTLDKVGRVSADKMIRRHGFTSTTINLGVIEVFKFLGTGQLPSRGKLYIETHKRKDGSFVNDAAKAIAEQIEVGLAQSATNESEVSPNDVVGRVLGPEHYGRVRCMGLGAAPTNSFRNTRLRLSDLSLASSSTATSSSCSNQWQLKYTNLESQVQTTLGALKAYMIMKEGKIPDELAVFFDPQPQVRTF
ncbi:hypothetical protein Fmac_019348 [Flemingia macrophylla]|uniref:Uncharacterized protein n=1 Tax=Flemingia macrophylla TaxID=520843 RepID=A0ABD1M7J7_9FABA